MPGDGVALASARIGNCNSLDVQLIFARRQVRQVEVLHVVDGTA
jgi:hypothetical protein